MDYQKKTVFQLKEICRKNKITGYSKLNKKDLISYIKKNIKKGGNKIMFYQKYNNDKNLYTKLQEYFINKNNFTKNELKKLTYFERYILYLDTYYNIFSNISSNNGQEYYKIIYQKNNINHKKNFSRLYFKNTSGSIKIIKLKNNLEYINDMILYFNKNTWVSISGSCNTGIRLRINKIKNEYNVIHNHDIFDDEVFCIPYNNPYIQKIIINNKKNYNVGTIYQK